MLRSNGLIPIGEGHVMQVEGLWRRLREDRSRFVLGQWGHSPPTSSAMPQWKSMVTAWFDHYLRAGPQKVQPGIVEYQDDAGKWHTAHQWPPRSDKTVVHLSGDRIVADGQRVASAEASFASADTDPGLNIEPGNPRYNVAVCGPHQALYVSPPAAEKALLAGNFTVDVKLSSTLPGGNFAVYLWKTKGDGSCPDADATAVVRALMDLRHWKYAGRSRNFPVASPTSFSLRSQPFASRLRKGERLVIAVGGGSVELTPDQFKPVLTLHRASMTLPVVDGRLRFARE
jgi:predicted acyl esterase